MTNKYPFFRYVSSSSKVHLMNSKMKIIWFLLTLISLLLINDLVSLCILSAFLLIIIGLSKIDVRAYVSNALLVWPLYVLLFILLLCTLLNPTIALIWTLKLFLIIILFLILTFTTSLSEIAWGFECAFACLKKINFPVSKASLKIAMDIKFISTIFEESKIVRKSMAYRGVSYNKNKLKSFKKMIVPVISLSYKLSRRMVKIMKLRFYGNKKRTNYHENKVTKFDKILVFSPVILIYVVIWLGWC